MHSVFCLLGVVCTGQRTDPMFGRSDKGMSHMTLQMLEEIIRKLLLPVLLNLHSPSMVENTLALQHVHDRERIKCSEVLA